MFKKFSFLFTLLLFSSVVFSQELVKQKLEYGIKIEIPESFTEMPDQEYRQKYSAYLSPIAKFTGPSHQADLIVNVSMNNTVVYKEQDAPMTEEDLEILQSMYRGTIQSGHSNVEFIQDEIKTINKQPFIVFEFVGEIQDVDSEGNYSGNPKYYYYYIQYTVKKEELLIFTFTCPQRSRGLWESIINQVMNSVKV